MPAMYVNAPKLDPKTRDRLVEKLYEATIPVFKGPKGPAIHTFVNEYETLYENGKIEETPKMLVINMEASALPADKIELIAEGLSAAAKEVLGDGQGTTFVYHANGLDHIAMNGKLLKK